MVMSIEEWKASKAKQTTPKVTFSNIPKEYKKPGSSFTGGGFHLPINPKLTGDEAAAVAAEEVFVPLARKMQEEVKGGIFKSPFGNFGRTYRQFAGGQSNPGSSLLTSYDPKLQGFQSHVKSLRRYIFGEGGKQLTPYEANVVMALIDPVGKSDEQYITDIGETTKLIEAKARIAKGGALAMRPPQRQPKDISTMSDDELQKLAGV